MRINFDNMDKVSEASYLSAPSVALYRTIMRILYREKQLYNSRLSTTEIMEKIIEFGQIPNPDIETLKGALTQLTDWGNVTAMQDLKDVHTIEEYKNKACHYSITERAVIMERAVIDLENMFSKGNVLSASLLDRIDKAVRDAEHIVNRNNYEVLEWWRNLQEDYQKLEQNFSDYVHIFDSVQGEKLMHSVDFLIQKDRFVEYLREFIRKLQKYSVIIEQNLKKIQTRKKDELLAAVLESEQNLPRIGTDGVNFDELKEQIVGQWNALYRWFVSESGRESECNRAMEYTNEIIRKIISVAMSLMQLSNASTSKKQDYQKFLELFSSCKNMEEAHCLSAHVFGVMQTEHYQYHTDREIDSIFENAADMQPQIFEIRPFTRSYKPRIRTQGFENRRIEKEQKRKEYLEAIRREQEMIEGYIQNNRISVADLSNQILPAAFRTSLLKWISFANQNQKHTGVTDFGAKYHLIHSEKKTVVHFSDGQLVIPAYIIEFEVKTDG